MHFVKFLMYPRRRLAFQIFCDLTWRMRRRRTYKSVNVIVDTADLPGHQAMLSRNAANICPYTLLNIGADVVNAVFGAKHDVKIYL